jgi:hypothetical protein
MTRVQEIESLQSDIAEALRRLDGGPPQCEDEAKGEQACRDYANLAVRWWCKACKAAGRCL